MAKVLIVDDNESFRRLNAQFLKMDGHEVFMARNGRETLDLVQQEHPDILLLDIMMPGMDGYAVCRKIKSDPTTQDTMVIVITALPKSSRARAVLAGADEHVTKPVHSRRLRDMVRQLADRKQRAKRDATDEALH